MAGWNNLPLFRTFSVLMMDSFTLEKIVNQKYQVVRQDKDMPTSEIVP